ncbi:glycosyltransferase family 4 protein [Rubellimicrobium sp. CFH 75288]|uniref:glycosyltransferase family 4 protein n=1 Tax=Rubellimicrobium sp. CFH 75288 TaxID=2697034 RepID=UPI00352B8907
MTRRRRPRILLLAEAANPEWVSVPLVGWSLARALAAVADVHLVTQIRNRDAILRAGLVEGRDVTALDTEAVTAPLWRLAERLRGGEGRGWTTLQAAAALAYPAFERAVWRRFGPSLRAGEWDIVHRVTPLSPTIPSPIAPRLARAGVPFVLGPLNGGVPWPRAFDAARRAEREWLSYLRGAARLLPGRRATYRTAALVLAGSRHTASEMPRGTRTVWLPENAADPARFAPDPSRPEGGPLRAVFLGRLVPYKGPDMALEAAAPLLAAGRLTLDIVGDGPLMPALRAQAAALGVAPAFHGWLPQEEAARILSRAHLLLFPSIREFGGGAVVEAMASAVCPLVVDYAGPGELVAPGRGLKVPLAPRAPLVAALRARLEALTPPEALRLGHAARAHVAAHLTWEAKARQIAALYEWVLGDRRAAPPEPLPEAA